MVTDDPISIFRGEDVVVPFTAVDDETGEPLDITSFTIEFNVKGATTVLITVPAAIIDGPSGRFDVSLGESITDALTPGHYLYDAWRTDLGSQIVLARGTFSVVGVARDVTL